METNLGSFVSINCCNQMGGRAKFIEIIESLEALVEEAYQEGSYDRQYNLETAAERTYQESVVKKQLDELKQEVNNICL